MPKRSIVPSSRSTRGAPRSAGRDLCRLRRSGSALPSTHGVPPHPRAAAVRVRPDRRAEDAPPGARMRTSSTSGSATPTSRRPTIAVEKLAEAVRNPRNHRYSTSKRHPEACGWRSPTSTSASSASTSTPRPRCASPSVRRRASRTSCSRSSARATPRSCRARRTRSTSGARSSPAPACTTCASGPDQDFFANLHAAWEQAWPRPRVVVTSFPHNPTGDVRRPRVHDPLVEFARERDVLVVHDFAYAELGFDGYEPPSILQVPGREGCRGRALHAHEVVLDGRLAHGLPRRQRRDRRRARAS